jgi:hypothetical protein
MKLLYIFLVALVISFSSIAQSVIQDTAFVVVAKKNSIALYEHALKTQKLYYNGSAYVEPDRTSDAHPFYLSDDWLNGSIVFDGNSFDNVPLLFDITTEQIITENPSATPISLVKEKLSSFIIDGRQFDKIHNEAVKNSLPRSGFYHILYNGKTKVVALHDKQTQERIEGRDLIIYFEERNRYYVWRKDRYHQVGGKGSILKLLHDQKNALRTFIRANKLDFKHNREDALSKVAEYYDTLTTTK